MLPAVRSRPAAPEPGAVADRGPCVRGTRRSPQRVATRRACCSRQRVHTHGRRHSVAVSGGSQWWCSESGDAARSSGQIESLTHLDASREIKSRRCRLRRHSLRPLHIAGASDALPSSSAHEYARCCATHALVRSIVARSAVPESIPSQSPIQQATPRPKHASCCQQPSRVAAAGKVASCGRNNGAAAVAIRTMRARFGDVGTPLDQARAFQHMSQQPHQRSRHPRFGLRTAAAHTHTRTCGASLARCDGWASRARGLRG